MRTSQTGVDLIKHFEGLRLETYRCSANVLTIGYGHTGPDVKPGMQITTQRAEQLLENDLVRFEKAVAAMCPGLAQHEFDALVAFAFNLGEGALRGSTLMKLLQAGDRKGAAEQFLRWNKAGGKVLAGLTRRREAEARLFKGADWRAAA